jgi:uncharacterized protein YukE
MTDLNVDFEQLRRSGAGIRSSADDASSRLAAFQSELSGYGEPWKGDPSPVGQLIGAIYGVISQAALEAFGDNSKAMNEHAKKVQSMAQNYHEAEDVSSIEVNRVREILG